MYIHTDIHIHISIIDWDLLCVWLLAIAFDTVVSLECLDRFVKSLLGIIHVLTVWLVILFLLVIWTGRGIKKHRHQFFYVYKWLIFCCWCCFLFGVACPVLRKVPNVLVIHGEADGTLEYMKVYKTVVCDKIFALKAFPTRGFSLTSWLFFREISQQAGPFTNLLYPFHMERTIPKRCFLSILKEWELLYIQQTWYTLIGITRAKVCGCKISHGRMTTVQARGVILKVIWLII